MTTEAQQAGDTEAQQAGDTEAQQAGDTEAQLGYGAALEELEALLDELEGADVDVDVLATRVARGVELIRFCRARLEVVTGDVDAIVEELVSLDGDAEPDPSAEDRSA